MMDKNREAFEAWLISTGEYAESQNDVYLSPIANISWDAWQASRQALEVEPPSRRHSQGETTAGNDYMAMGFNLALEQYAEAITSLGIRLKGNEE